MIVGLIVVVMAVVVMVFIGFDLLLSLVITLRRLLWHAPSNTTVRMVLIPTVMTRAHWTWCYCCIRHGDIWRCKWQGPYIVSVVMHVMQATKIWG